MRRMLGLALAAGLVVGLGQPAQAAIASPRSARSTSASSPSADPALTGLHVVGNRLVTGSGSPVVLHGVNRAGTEYACAQGWGIFDGPADDASVAAIASWHVNVVRVPLNEDCWLGINGVRTAFSGTAYRSAIMGYVARLHAHGLGAVLDLHWNAAGGQLATGQQSMPDADHSPAFWASVASAFRTDTATLLDLYNEPRDVSWQCWRDGGSCGQGYQVAGMQSLVSVVRATGARNVVLVAGLNWAGDLSEWLTHRPTDPTGNLAASWHTYNFSQCRTVACWDATAGPVAARVPLVAGEIGENDCAHGFIDALMAWLDRARSGYLGWGWNTASCSGFPALVSDYAGTPTAFGAGLRAHLAVMPGAGAPRPPAPAPPTPAPPAPPVLPAPSVGSLVIRPSVNAASAPWWWEEDLHVTPGGSITGLAVTVRVAATPSMHPAGGYTTDASISRTSVLSSTGPPALVWTFRQDTGATRSATAGDLVLAAQFSATGLAHPTVADTWQVTAVVDGRLVSTSGHF